MFYVLQILSTVLDATPFPFSIKLASIASRKEHINLEKWLSEKLSAHKNVFFEVRHFFLVVVVVLKTWPYPLFSLHLF